jgi:threonine dehydratase
VADGIAARVPVAEALELMLSVVDEMVLVEETAILDATAELSAAVPFSIEPAAGAGWAAIRQKTHSDGAIGLILTGGNVAP